MLLILGLVEVLLFQHLSFKPPFGLVLVKGVILLALASTRVVVAQASLLLAHLGGNQQQSDRGCHSCSNHPSTRHAAGSCSCYGTM